MFAEFIRSSDESQVAWARRLGVSTSHMSGLLSGKKLPSLELAVRIERATGGRVPAASWVPDGPEQQGDAA